MMPGALEMLDQMAAADARLDESGARREVRQERRDRCGRGVVRILRKARKVAALTYCRLP